MSKKQKKHPTIKVNILDQLLGLTTKEAFSFDLSKVSINELGKEESTLVLCLQVARKQIDVLESKLKNDMTDLRRDVYTDDLSLLKNFRKKLLITLRLWHEGWSDTRGEVEEDEYGMLIQEYNEENDTELSWEQYFDDYSLYV